ncbi:MAG: monovalent cation/H+ antiporter complex subunit F [Rubrimonas sp.]|uniref:monovalent cation/H+ antiporter complex subunit F n=1 Tax=Rubrimonas sp. TaxID=2036015 RepID=UPI002FDCA322
MMLFETRLEGILALAAQGCGAMLIAAFALGALRVALGPTAADRVVALDFVAMTLVAFLMLLALAARRDAYLDAALALALVAFLATVAFARLLERRGRL